jgi:serine/threonine protein kinase
MEQRYEIREKIEQGGVGNIYRGYDHRMKRNVAFKRIIYKGQDASFQEGNAKQIINEISALCSLQHPNIITVYDISFDEVGPYIVTELLDGKNLQEIVKDSPLAWDDFRTVTKQSLDALIAAHHFGMIHRNLKTSNIMITITPSGAIRVKILDFTLATLIDKQSQEEIKLMVDADNSVYFMSPEQYEGQKLDARSDIYSLGCCFYQMLTGRYPFNGNNGVEVMQAHFHHYVRPIEEIRSDIPLWVCDWVMWMISRHPNDRPPTMREALSIFELNEEYYYKNKDQIAYTSQPQRLIYNPSSYTTAIDSPSEIKPVHRPLVIGSATAKGRRCQTNNDRHLIDTCRGWFAISSSVDDLPFGDRASECAIRHLMREIMRPDAYECELSDIILSCHEAVRKLGAFIAPATGIGATLTLIRFNPQTTLLKAQMASVGNNLVYCHPGCIHPLECLNTEQIIDNWSEYNDGDTPSNAQLQLDRTRYLGHDDSLDCEICQISLDSNDRIILCSDGVNKALNEAEIADLSGAKSEAADLAQSLVGIANIRYSRANATAIVIDIPAQ